jgi:putative DNA primase/helicase
MNQLETVSPWAQPEPLASEVATYPYPVEALPETILSAVKEVQAFVQAPIPLVAASALSALSVATQAYVDVQRGDKLVGPSGLFMLTIADSGERKTSCDNYFLEVIKEYETRQLEDAKPLIQEYLAELQSWEATKRGVTLEIQRLAKDGEPTRAENQRLVEIQSVEPVEPKIPSLLYVDATPEALMYKLWKSWPVGGVISSEAGNVFGSHGMGSDSLMRNLSMYNELWSGSPIKIDRRGSDSYTLQNARLSMGLMVQEAPLRNFFDKSDGLARGSGFIARFLISWPKSTTGTRLYVEAPRDWPALNQFNKSISSILNDQAPISETGILAPKLIGFTPEAKRLWVKFHDDVEVELLPDGEMFGIKDVASKAADNVARLACLFHVFECGIETPIGEESVIQAGLLVTWHLHEARRFIEKMFLPAAQSNAVELDQWLIGYCNRNKTGSVPRRIIQQFVTPGRLRKGSTLNAALEELADTNRAVVSVEERKNTIIVNPHLLSEGDLR